jgi:hypothetical protein
VICVHRAKDFPTLKTSWNNEYHQSIDEKDEMAEGKPVLHGIMSGKFYDVQTFKAPKQRKIAGLEFDPGLNQPMAKSLIHGAYYPNPNEMRAGLRTARSKKDFIQRNRTMTRNYSQLVKSARSQNVCGETWDRTMATPRTTGPFHKIPHSAIKEIRSAAQNVTTPRNADELQDMWGRALDPKFIATTMTWLQKASPEEKTNFKAAVAGASTLVPSRKAVFPDRAFKDSPVGARPSSSRSQMQATIEKISASGQNAFSDGAMPKPLTTLRPTSAFTPRNRVEPAALDAAIAFARSRPVASARGTGPERFLTPRTPRMPTGRPSTGSPRRPPMSLNSAKRGTNQQAPEVLGTHILLKPHPPPVSPAETKGVKESTLENQHPSNPTVHSILQVP